MCRKWMHPHSPVGVGLHLHADNEKPQNFHLFGADKYIVTAKRGLKMELATEMLW